MPDLEKKARVISIAGSTSKVKVISVSSGERKVRVWIPTIGDSTPNDALDFVIRYRYFAKLELTYGFLWGMI
jgi:hypothetical protein